MSLPGNCFGTFPPHACWCQQHELHVTPATLVCECHAVLLQLSLVPHALAHILTYLIENLAVRQPKGKIESSKDSNTKQEHTLKLLNYLWTALWSRINSSISSRSNFDVMLVIAINSRPAIKVLVRFIKSCIGKKTHKTLNKWRKYKPYVNIQLSNMFIAQLVGWSKSLLPLLRSNMDIVDAESCLDRHGESKRHLV